MVTPLLGNAVNGRESGLTHGPPLRALRGGETPPREYTRCYRDEDRPTGRRYPAHESGHLPTMPGSYTKHLDDFGICECDGRTGVEPMSLESQDEYGRYTTEQVPACAKCFGLK